MGASEASKMQCYAYDASRKNGYMMKKVSCRREISLEDNTRLSAIVRPAEGATLVLIHGSSGSARSFDSFLPLLDPALHLSLVLPDLRGHGESWPPPAPGTGRIEQLTDDVLRQLDSLNIDTFYIGGQSIGGMIAIDSLRARPAAVRGVIPLEGFTHHTVLEEAFGGDMFSTLSDTSLAKMQEEKRERLANWTEEQLEEWPRIWQRWQHGYELLLHTDKPVLEVWGDRGRPRPSRQLLQIPDRNNIELHWVSHASHSLLYENPPEVARTVNSFICGLEAR